MKRMSRAGLMVAVLAVVIGVVPVIVRAQDDPAWVTYTTEDGVLTFDVPAQWIVTDDGEYGVNLASDPAAVGPTDNLADGHMVGQIASPAFVAERLTFGGRTPADDLMAQAEALTDNLTFDYTYFQLDENTILAVDINGPGLFEGASIFRRVGDAGTVEVSGYTHHGQLVYFLDDLIALTQSITINTPGGLPALTETYVTLDEVMAIHYPAGWAVHLFNPGTILFGNNAEALDHMINRGQVYPNDMLFTLVTPSVTTALMGDTLTPDTTPEDALAFFIALSNATDAYGEVETVTVGDYPAARAFMAQHDFQVVTVVVQLAPGQFAMFDLMVDQHAFDQHLPLLDAIMASAEVLGE